MKIFFLENLNLKTAAVFISVILWFFVTSRGQSEIPIDVPLEFKNIPQGLELVNYSTKEIALTIKGQERIIKNVKPFDVRIYIDLGKTKKGESIYYISRDDIKLPRAITVTNINPSSIRIITEETRTKTVKVKPIIVGEPQIGYYIRSVEVVPHTAVIEGTRSEVARMNILKTESLDVTGFNETLTQELKLDLTGTNVRAGIKTVNVKVIIGAAGK